MITVARYSAREEAFVAKALLEAADIQVFLDDAGYTDTKTIEIRVPENQAERARALLADREETIRTVNGDEQEDPGVRKESTDMLLFLKAGGLWVFGYVLLGLVLRALGVILPFHPIILGTVFFVGGLIGLIFGTSGKKRSSR